MRLISVNSLKPGEILACNIYSGQGTTLIRRNTELTEKMVTRLKSVGIYSVYIEDDQFEDVKIRFPLTDDSKAEAIMELKELLEKIRLSRPVRHDAIRKLGVEIYQEVKVASIEPINVVSTFATNETMAVHHLNTAIITAAICEKLSVAPAAATNYVTGALVHDAFLLNSDEDFDDKGVHAQKIYNFLKGSSSYDTACYLPAYLHHEQFDGKGERRMVGKQIHEGARILAVADLFDNVLTGQAGYDALIPYQAVEYVTAQTNTLLDPDVVSAFTRSVAVYPTGSTVGLSTGKEAIVIRQNNGQPARPIVRTIAAPGQSIGEEFDLLAHHTLFIERTAI